ncbi:MAG: IS110 family transposase [Verrucomicrobiota bacterium]
MNSHYKIEKIQTEINHVGIDVSKQHLDVSIAGSKTQRLANTQAGLRLLHQKLGRLAHPRVTCEATGGYEKLLVDSMLDAEIEVCVAAPGRVRYLANAEGLLAKTDSIDAELIRRFAEKIPLPRQIRQDPAAQKLRQMSDYRRMLSEDIVKTSNRLELAQGYLREQLQSQLAHLESLMKKVEVDIKAHIRNYEELAQKAARLQELKGVGPVLAATLLAHVPELGKVGDKTLACLVGVAPHPKQSGNFKGKASIRGGRAIVRHVLYMAAVTAVRSNPILAAFYQRLRTQSGKTAKVALVAVMRKMLSVLNKMVAQPNFSLAH